LVKQTGISGQQPIDTDAPALSGEQRCVSRAQADRRRRIRLFSEAYGVAVTPDLKEWLIQRLTALCDTLQNGANEGNFAFQKMIDAGHLDHYEAEIRFVTDHFEDWQ
jgi:hypothetical protein